MTLGSIDANVSPKLCAVTDVERLSGEDWDAVADAIRNRLAQTRMTQMDVASRARISLTTVRELQHNLNPRRRRPQTLPAISEALGWPSGYLDQVLRGGRPEPHDDEVKDPVLRALDNLGREVQDLRNRVEQIERQSAVEDVQP
ncbi:MAG: helix-turn-helix domain-containing protein [Pseudonocardiaceae bacterium]